MRKFLFLFFVSLVSFTASAQRVTSSTIPDGYYRVRNVASGRYLALLDSKGWARRSGGQAIYDLRAIRTLLDNDVNDIYSNPATIIRITPVNRQYDCSAQGTSLHAMTNYYFSITNRNSNYQLRGEQSGGSVVLSESNNFNEETEEYLPDSGFVGLSTRDGNRINMTFYKVTSNTDSYFGFRPTIKVGDKYYDTFYAAFPFKVASDGVKVYGVVALSKDNRPVLMEFKNSVIPANTPVVIECSSDNPKDNQVDPVIDNSKPATPNLLRGIYFNYSYKVGDVTTPTQQNRVHFNKTTYNPSTMRVLGVGEDGKIAFVKASNLDYLPANKAYLPVDASAADNMSVISYEEYTSGINNVVVDKKADDAVYTLDGVKVDATKSLPHGIYIVGGKKVVK